MYYYPFPYYVNTYPTHYPVNARHYAMPTVKNRNASQTFSNVWGVMEDQLDPSYQTLTEYNMDRKTATILIQKMVQFVLQYSNTVTGSLTQQVHQLWQKFRQVNSWIVQLLMQYRIPEREVERFTKNILKLSLENVNYSPSFEWAEWESLGGQLTSGPSAISVNNNVVVFARGLQRDLLYLTSKTGDWETLGGNISSSPAAVTTTADSISVFVRGGNKELLHISRNGGEWSDWETLGGVLTTSPAACSNGENRVDVFVRGTDRGLYQKSWNGQQWSDWFALGGNLTSAPAAVSLNEQRIDLFARGTSHELIHKYWNGEQWSDWHSLDGRLTSSPSVVIDGKNRLTVFARGENYMLMLKRWDGRKWREWEVLEGTITSEPSAICTKKRIDVYARGEKNELLHIVKEN